MGFNNFELRGNSAPDSGMGVSVILPNPNPHGLRASTERVPLEDDVVLRNGFAPGASSAWRVVLSAERVNRAAATQEVLLSVRTPNYAYGGEGWRLTVNAPPATTTMTADDGDDELLFNGESFSAVGAEVMSFAGATLTYHGRRRGLGDIARGGWDGFVFESLRRRLAAGDLCRGRRTFAGRGASGRRRALCLCGDFWRGDAERSGPWRRGTRCGWFLWRWALRGAAVWYLCGGLSGFGFVGRCCEYECSGERFVGRGGWFGAGALRFAFGFAGGFLFGAGSGFAGDFARGG